MRSNLRFPLALALALPALLGLARPVAAGTEPSVLVIPFNPTGQVQASWLSPGIGAVIAEAVTETGIPALGPGEALRALSERGLPAHPDRLVREPVLVARELGLKHVISGTWTPEGPSGVHVWASLFDIENDRTLARSDAGGAMAVLAAVLGEAVLGLMDDERRSKAAPKLEQLSRTPYTELSEWMKAAPDPTREVGRLAALTTP